MSVVSIDLPKATKVCLHDLLHSCLRSHTFKSGLISECTKPAILWKEDSCQLLVSSRASTEHEHLLTSTTVFSLTYLDNHYHKSLLDEQNAAPKRETCCS